MTPVQARAHAALKASIREHGSARLAVVITRLIVADAGFAARFLTALAEAGES